MTSPQSSPSTFSDNSRIGTVIQPSFQQQFWLTARTFVTVSVYLLSRILWQLNNCQNVIRELIPGCFVKTAITAYQLYNVTLHEFMLWFTLSNAKAKLTVSMLLQFVDWLIDAYSTASVPTCHVASLRLARCANTHVYCASCQGGDAQMNE